MKKRIALIVILVILIGFGFGIYSVTSGLDKPYKSGNTETFLIEIPMGSSTGDIAETLEVHDVIESATKFKLFSKINKYDGNYVAGIYELSPGMTATEICDKIVAGDTASFKFTIPEGYTLTEITDKLEAEGLIIRSEFEDLLRNGDYSEYEFLNYVPDDIDKANRLEGYLFPETYILPLNSSEDDIIRAMLDGFQRIYEENIRGKEGNVPGYNLHEIMTVASIIEKETMHLSDKDKVASVIYNRLDDGMRLQMDTTVIYAMEEKKVDLTYDDIEIDSPYNTYLVDGLPIGPICNPSLEAIDAALNPAETDYYYFVVSDKGDGSIKFAETDWEFEEDKEAYYASREDDD